jgi:predicted ABC-type ATPase
LRRLDLIVGPNGAGKTTFVTHILSAQLPVGVPFVNADEIARQQWPEDPAAHAYDAAELAERTRAKLLLVGISFIAESVFSHPSKVELVRVAKQNDYTVIMHVLLIPEFLAVRRVAYRVQAGGHDVPEQKIRERYARLWKNVAASVPLVDTVIVYDNSRHSGPVIVAEFQGGMALGPLTWPDWTPQPLRAPH